MITFTIVLQELDDGNVHSDITGEGMATQAEYGLAELIREAINGVFSEQPECTSKTSS